jgi:hypothetical protein
MNLHVSNIILVGIPETYEEGQKTRAYKKSKNLHTSNRILVGIPETL